MKRGNGMGEEEGEWDGGGKERWVWDIWVFMLSVLVRSHQDRFGICRNKQRNANYRCSVCMVLLYACVRAHLLHKILSTFLIRL